MVIQFLCKMKLMNKYQLFVLIAILCSGLFNPIKAQKNIQLGIEHNVYPAGNIPGLIAQSYNYQTPHSWNFRLAVNIARRKDFSGLNDDERGWGPGISVGYRYYLNTENAAWYAGLRSDLWYMQIDWIDNSEPIDRGTTKIWVVQPMLELGYVFELNENWNFGLGLNNGFEVNVITDGEEVGQGFITLGTVHLMRKFSL